MDTINKLNLSVKTYVILDELCSIINTKGINDGLPWIDDNGIKQLHIAGSDMTVERLRLIYYYNKSNNIDFRSEFLDVLSLDQYYTVFDILHYNHYGSTPEEIVNRHPILYAYNTYLLDLNPNIYKMINDNITESVILLKLQENKNSASLPGEIKIALAKAIYQNLSVKYNNNDTILQVLTKLNITNKQSVILALAKTMNKLILFITPNHDYLSEESLALLGNTTLKALNENLFNIRYYKNLHYLRNADIHLSHSNAFILLNILYRRYDVLGNNTNKTIDAIGKGILYPNLKDKDKGKGKGKDDILLGEILTSDLKLINCSNVAELIKHIRTLIKKNHPKISYNILTTKITKYTSIKDVSNMLIFGI